MTASALPRPQLNPLEDLVTALLPQGFARIVQPIASTTITTDTNGLTAGEVTIQTMTGKVPACRAAPDGSGKFPAVLVVQEIFGVLYDGVPHAFYADYRPSYRKEAAEDGWKRMQGWFRQHGVA